MYGNNLPHVGKCSKTHGLEQLSDYQKISFVWFNFRQHSNGYVDVTHVSYQVDTESEGEDDREYTLHAHWLNISPKIFLK
jgi:hypothetical protein